MKRALTSIAISALTLALTSPATAQSTQKLSASKANEYALIYSLPKTVVDITIETEHTTRTPGEFSNYARRHLNITDAITSADESVNVKSVTLNVHGVADPDNRWASKFKAGQTPTMLLTKAGVPLGINVDEVNLPAAPTLPVARDAEPTALETPAAKEAVTLDMTRSSSLSKKAELAAARIFELRETRNDLISGNAENTPPDGQSMKLALDNLSAQEAALTAMFSGTTKTYTRVTTVSIVPDTVDIDNQIIARLSAVDDIVEPGDLSGEPITVSVNVVNRAKLPVNEKGEAKTFPKGGVAYAIPGSAEVVVSWRGKVIARSTFDIAQLGVTFGIDPALFTDKKAPAAAEFSPVTGALTRLTTLE
jgi:hypothetical protein